MGKNSFSSGWQPGQLWGDLSCTVSLGSLKFRGCELQAMPGSCLDTSLSLLYATSISLLLLLWGRKINTSTSSATIQVQTTAAPARLLQQPTNCFLASLLGVSLLHHSQNVAVKTYSDHVTLLLPSASPRVKAKVFTLAINAFQDWLRALPPPLLCLSSTHLPNNDLTGPWASCGQAPSSVSLLVLFLLPGMLFLRDWHTTSLLFVLYSSDSYMDLLLPNLKF